MSRTAILKMALISLSLTVAAGAGAGIIETEYGNYADDSFLAFFEEPIVSSSVDSICALFECAEHVQIGSSTVGFYFAGAEDITAMVAQCNALSLSSFVGAEFNYVFSMDQQSSADKATVPEILRMECSVEGDEFSQQWYLNNDCMGVCQAWETTKGADEDLVLVIIDSGIDLNHEEFADDIGYYDDGIPNRIEVKQVSPIQYPWQVPGMDYSGHGTALAGIIGAPHNDLGIGGIAPECNMIVVDFGRCPLNISGPEGCLAEGQELFLDDSLAALDFVTNIVEANLDKRFIVNCAWGYPFLSDSDIVGAWAAYMTRCQIAHNTLFVAAMGNAQPSPKDLSRPLEYASYPALFSGERGPFYSEALDNIVVAVGGTSYYTNYYPDEIDYAIKAGDYAAWASDDTCQMIADVSAPGGGSLELGGSQLNIYSTTSTNSVPSGYDTFMGTSVACAQITGISALCWAANNTLTPEELKYQLRSWSKDSVVADGASKLYGATWGANKCRGFRVDCPLPEIADPIPLIWPMPGDKSVDGGILFDTWCSPVFGNGMPDASTIVEAGAVPRNVCRIYGGTLENDVILEDVDVIRVYGDLTIPNGITFQANPPAGTSYLNFSVYTGDFTHAGEDTNAVEIVVEDGGVFETNCPEVKIVPDKFIPNPQGCWYGLTCSAGAQFGLQADPCALTIEGAVNGLSVQTPGFYIGDLSVQATDCAVELSSSIAIGSIAIDGVPAIGLQMNPDAELSLTGGGQILTGRQYGDAGIVQYGNNSIVINSGTLAVDGFYVGLIVPGAGSLMSGDFAVDNCVLGLLAFQDYACISGNVAFNGSGNGTGITCQNYSTLDLTQGVSCTVSGFDTGFKIDRCGEILGPMVVTNANIYGGLICDSTIGRVEDVTILGSDQDGLRISQSTGVTVRSLILENCAGAGMGLYGYSNANIRGSVFSGNSSGIFVDGTSQVNAGVFYPEAERGLNSMETNSMYGVINLNQNSTALAEGNVWLYKGVVVCPPDPNKFVGSVSTVCE